MQLNFWKPKTAPRTRPVSTEHPAELPTKNIISEQYRIECRDGCIKVLFGTSVDASGVADACENVRDLCALVGKDVKVVIDLSLTDFIDASFYAEQLIDLSKIIRSFSNEYEIFDPQRVSVIGADPETMYMAEITRLNKTIAQFSGRDDSSGTDSQ